MIFSPLPVSYFLGPFTPLRCDKLYGLPLYYRQYQCYKYNFKKHRLAKRIPSRMKHSNNNSETIPLRNLNKRKCRPCGAQCRPTASGVLKHMVNMDHMQETLGNSFFIHSHISTGSSLVIA